MKATEITKGTKVIFTPTGDIFEIAKVTEQRLSWFVPAQKSSWGKNTMRMTWLTLNSFQKGIDTGVYIINA